MGQFVFALDQIVFRFQSLACTEDYFGSPVFDMWAGRYLPTAENSGDPEQKQTDPLPREHYYTLLVPDMFVDIQVVLSGVVPGKIIAHAVCHQLSEVLRVGIPHAYCAPQGRHDPVEIEVVEYITVPLVIRPIAVVGIEDRVPQSSGCPHNGHCPVFQGDYLGQPAGLKETRDDHHVGTRIDEVREFFVKSDLEVTVRVVIQLVLEMEENIIGPVVRARTQKDELTSV